ncbi:MAG: hypothetical protein J6Y85_02690 [Alphaproteobacteria bacterium]|nr:hypothetical protein [Alphaproteobacteria bacterium]
MLGVLAIMGVLSLTSLYGYQRFQTKRRADALLYEINLRATDYSSKLIKNPPSTELTPLDTSHFDSDMGYTFQAGASLDQFYVTVNDVPQKVCELVLSAQYKVPFQVNVNEYTNVNGDEDACDQDQNSIEFHFKNDLQECQNCTATEICKVGEIYCGSKCYNPETHECLYPNNEVCQRAPYSGSDTSPICQVGEDRYTCCAPGATCRLNEATSYYECAQCTEYEKAMSDGTCCALEHVCGDVCCSNENYVCKENMYCVREEQWCNNTACASDQRCTAVGCCKVYKACQDNTTCCEEGEVCSQNSICCPEEQAAALKCCAVGEIGYKNLCCNKETTTPLTVAGLDICCPKDQVCTNAQGQTICSKYPNAASGDAPCEAVSCAEGQSLCNLTCYDPNLYDCTDDGSLCRTGGVNPNHINCGGTCCDTTTSTCINNQTCCPNERVNGGGETASCCASGTTVVDGACCANNRKCVIDNQEVCCPEGNCCEISTGYYACCPSGTTCSKTSNSEATKACLAPVACESNADCLETQFCQSADKTPHGASPQNGTCTNISKSEKTLELDGQISTWVRSGSGGVGLMNRWSAENFCDALGMTLMTEELFCPGGDITQIAEGSTITCDDYALRYMLRNAFANNLLVHVKRTNDTTYACQLGTLNIPDSGTVKFGPTKTAVAMCMPKDFGGYRCPSTRPYYSPGAKTCVARRCSADINGTVVDECPNNEYCHYETTWDEGECAGNINYMGVCRPVDEVTQDLEFQTTIDGNTVNHTCKMSTKNMPWLSAEDLCHKLGRQVITRSQLCGLATGLGLRSCSQSATYSSLGKSSVVFWLEEDSACLAYRHATNEKLTQ